MILTNATWWEQVYNLVIKKAYKSIQKRKTSAHVPLFLSFPSVKFWVNSSFNECVFGKQSYCTNAKGRCSLLVDASNQWVTCFPYTS